MNLRERLEERFQEQRRTGDVTWLSVAVCAGIVLLAVWNTYHRS